MVERQSGQILYLVVPCYNEEAVLPKTVDVLRSVMSSMIKEGRISPKSQIVFIDDGSRDGTWHWLKKQMLEDPMIGALSLSHNAGHQNALYAGLMAVRNCCDMAISMDCDLQDDPALIPVMVEQFYAGNDIVYAVRRSRKQEDWFKRGTAFLFYRFMKLLGTEVPADCGDFRLLSRQALDYLALYQEERPFLRGLVPLLGLPSSSLYFARRPRKDGTSKYSTGRMVTFALDGICSMSTRPLSFLLLSGLIIFGFSGLWLLFHLFSPVSLETVIAVLWAVCGLILTGMGILGQYIGRSWQATLHRPRFLIRETCNIRCETSVPEQPQEKETIH